MAPSAKAGPSEVVVFELWMETTCWLFERTTRFPKRLRHTLTARIEQTAIELLELLTTAAWQRDKRATLRAANTTLDRLRVLLRLAHALNVLSHAHYEHAARQMGETGRQIGGWLRHEQNPNTAGSGSDDRIAHD